MNRLGINRAGREIINSGVPATNNFVAGDYAHQQRTKEKQLERRKDWSTEQFEGAIKSLEEILNLLTKRYKGILGAQAEEWLHSHPIFCIACTKEQGQVSR